MNVLNAQRFERRSTKILAGCLPQNWVEAFQHKYNLSIIRTDTDSLHSAWQASRHALESVERYPPKKVDTDGPRALSRSERKLFNKAVKHNTELQLSHDYVQQRLVIFDVRSLLVSQLWIADHHDSYVNCRNLSSWISLCLGETRLDNFVALSDGSIELSSRRRRGAYISGMYARRISSQEIEVVSRVRATPGLMRVIRHGSDFVLVNGHHRAYGLMANSQFLAMCILDEVPYDQLHAAHDGSLLDPLVLRNFRPTMGDFASSLCAPSFELAIARHTIRVRSRIEFGNEALRRPSRPDGAHV